MDFFTGVSAQPEALARSADSVRSVLADLDLRPWRSGMVAVVSMGASSAAAAAFVDRLNRHLGRAVAIDASKVLTLGRAALADCYIFVSEGGRSRETLDAAALCAGRPRLVVTNAPDSPLVGFADSLLPLGHGDDSTVSTVGYTATVQALGILATALDGSGDGDDWKLLAQQVERTLDLSLKQCEELAEPWSALTAIDCFGSGASHASALEAALLLRESTRLSAASFETRQYLHGPMESLTGTSACLGFGDDLEARLGLRLAAEGVLSTLVTPGFASSAPNFSVLGIPEAPPLSRAILEILPVQLLAGEVARRRGLDCQTFLFNGLEP
jgi:glutamine---fructose-6-phosphate transaminase (isomerizing)